MGNDEKDMKLIVPTQQGGGDNNNDWCGGGGYRRNNHHHWQQGRQGGTQFKGKIKEIADDIFNNTWQHDAATFNKSLKNIVDYLQLKIGNDVSEAVRNITNTTINIPDAPRPKPDPKISKVMIPSKHYWHFPMET